MSTVSTAFLPLTTTFTAPAGCWDTTWIIQEVPTTWWKQGGDNQLTCFPPAYPFSISSIIYSPGICPAGWTSACNRGMTTSGQEMNVVSCCPSAYACAITTSAVHDWEDQFGCVAPFSVDKTAWNMSSDAPHVSSIYQMHIMIVEETTATSSSFQTALPQPASTVTSPAVPTSASPSPTLPSGFPVPSSGGLAKSTIAGIAIGVTVGIAVIALLAYIAWTLHGKRRAAGHVGLSAMTQYPEQAGEIQYDVTHYTDTEPTEMDAVQQRAVYELKAH